MAGTHEVSHGRGGAGNLAEDDTQYVDGEVVREGVEGSHGDGAFSTGRGGAANIGDSGKPAEHRHDHEVVPEAATVPDHSSSDYHTGRGGAGNEHLAPGHEHAAKAAVPEGTQSLADKLKSKVFGIFKKEK